MSKKRFVPIVLIATTMVICAHSISINKCCPKGEHFGNRLSCTRPTKPIIELTKNITAKSDFEINYGVMPCNDNTLYLASSDFFAIAEDGSLEVLRGNKKDSYSRESFCLEVDSTNTSAAYLCPCVGKLCVWKCCNHGTQLFVETDENGTITSNFCDDLNGSPGWHHGVLGKNISREYEIMINYRPCDKQRLYLEEKFTLNDDGSLQSETHGIIQPGDYCSDYRVVNNGSREVTVLACLGPPVSNSSMIFGIMGIVGILILVLTVAIQLWLPDLPWLSSRMLGMHAGSLTVAYIALVISILGTFDIESGSCLSVGYVMQFSFLAAFFWLNVMCIDMSWTFSGIRPPSGSQRDREKRKFMWYSFYAWGGACLLTLAAIIVEYASGISEESPYKPNIGVIKCWFKEKEALWLYFYGPMGLLLLCNLGLFVYTSVRILILRRGTGALRHADSAQHGNTRNKQKFVLYAKLFLLMGVTWLTEIISWAVGGSNTLDYVWYITDAINLLRAVFIFIIFCWKPRVWANIKKRITWVKKCDEQVKLLFCKRNAMDGNEDQKTSSTNGGPKESDTKVDSLEMQAR